LDQSFLLEKSLHQKDPTIRYCQSHTQEFQQTISNGNSSYGSFDSANISYSIDIFSTYESTLLFIDHFTAPIVVTARYGVKSVDSNMVFRIGSLTKLFTIYTFLIEVGDAEFSDSITKYVPKLLQAAEATNSVENSLD
jgi:hypothetical protein